MYFLKQKTDYIFLWECSQEEIKQTGKLSVDSDIFFYVNLPFFLYEICNFQKNMIIPIVKIAII